MAVHGGPVVVMITNKNLDKTFFHGGHDDDHEAFRHCHLCYASWTLQSLRCPVTLQKMTQEGAQAVDEALI